MVSMPSFSGMKMSVTITSAGRARWICRPMAPLAAPSASIEWIWNHSSASLRKSSLSSMTRTRVISPILTRCDTKRSMEDADFSDDFCRFLQSTIPAVDAAELLLLLRRTPEKSWLTAELTAALRPSVPIPDADAAKYIELFQARNMVALGEDSRASYRPASEELRMYGDMLALAYKERPVTLIRMIYALRDARIQTFADAFKLRRTQ